jgi:hypothetical protein
MTNEQAQQIESMFLQMTDEQRRKLYLILSFGMILKEELRKEFEIVHLSKQLYNSIQLVPSSEDGKIHIRIPAQIYDIALYRKRGVIKPISQNSYAWAVNRSGGFSGTHKDYVSRCIYSTIRRWQTENNIHIQKLNTSIRK